jgi:hypothetical protein
MSIYTILAPPPRTGDIAPDPLSLVFVKEGFCWPALFFPEIWLIFRRLWLVLVLDIASVLVLAVSVILSHAGSVAVPILLLGRILLALEANGLRRWTYYRHGYRLVGVVEGRRLWEAELRFFLDWAPETSAATPPPEPEPPRPRPPSPEAGDVVGLFPAPGAAT